MNGILTRRARDGAERWRVASREIGMGRVAVSGANIYVTGYSTAHPPLPLVRSFDLSGRQRWETEFSDLGGFIPADVIATAGGMTILMMPFLVASGASHNVMLVSVSADGRIGKRVTLERQSPDGYGGAGVLAMWNGRLVVAVSANPTRELDFNKKEISGLPRICWQGLHTTAYEVDPASLEVRASRTIEGFKVKALDGDASSLFIGGELVDPCGLSSVAGVAAMKETGEASIIWKDDELFSSSVSGMAVGPKHVWVGIDRKRDISLGLGDARQVEDYGYKHWSEATGKNEGTILKLLKDGSVIDREDMSAGLNLFVHGLIAKDDRVLAYGSLGGVPGFTPFAERASTGTRTPERPTGTWITDVFGTW